MDPDLIRLDFGALDDAGERGSGPVAIGEILAELLAQYQARFPDAQITVVDTSAAA